MRFAWTEDQESFRDAVRLLLENECPPAVVRRAWAGAVDDRPWLSLAEMGALSVLVDETDGGLGLDECFLVPVLEETGRAALPHPVVEMSMVAEPLGVSAEKVATDLGGTVVPFAQDAAAFILLRDGALTLHRADEVETTIVETVDGARRAARIEPAGPGELVTDRPADIALTFDRGVLGTAAQLVGLSRTMLALTVGHVSERQQFGKPIGSFQAVKHHLANAALAVEFAAPAVARAAWSTASRDPQRRRDVSMAKWLANDAALTTGRIALQCHGAVGYTIEHDLHLYTKRSWALARTWGDTSFHTDRVSAAIAGS
jgi:alkylation response protein AidB-like acyl-CoA dehydrogenase